MRQMIEAQFLTSLMKFPTLDKEFLLQVREHGIALSIQLFFIESVCICNPQNLFFKWDGMDYERHDMVQGGGTRIFPRRGPLFYVRGCCFTRRVDQKIFVTGNHKQMISPPGKKMIAPLNKWGISEKFWNRDVCLCSKDNIWLLWMPAC